MNNRARMIERARRMHPKKKNLLEILARLDTTAFKKALEQTVEVLSKFCRAYAEHLKNMEE